MTPDFERDFVKVPRGILRSLARDAVGLQVYMLCLVRARWVAGPEVGPHGLIPLQPGEATVGRAELAAITSTNEASIRGALGRLQALGLLTIKTTKRGTIVKLCGYGETSTTTKLESPTEHQVSSPTEHQTERQQDANRTPTDSPTEQPTGQPLTRRVEGKEEQSARETDLDLRRRKSLRNRKWTELEQLRQQLAAEFGIQARPPPAQDPGELELAARIVEAGDRAEADIDHVLAIGAAEARAMRPPSLKWFHGGMFGQVRWRNALARSLEDVQHEGAESRAKQRSAAELRQDAEHQELLDRRTGVNPMRRL